MMNTAETNPSQRPWYREPWPWVLIAIPLLTVIASGITLWLALANPEYLVVKDEEYDQIRSEMRAQNGDDD